MLESYKVGSDVWIVSKQASGKIVSVDHNGMYYIDLDSLYNHEEPIRVTTYYSDLKPIETFNIGDRVYCKNKGKYGTVDRTSSRNVGVVIDGQSHAVYMAHPVDLILSWEDTAQLVKPEIKVGTRVRYIGGDVFGMVIERDKDSISVISEKNGKKFKTSVFVVDKTKKQPSKKSVRQQIRNKDPRYSVLATWIKSNKRVYRIISVQHLVVMIRNNHVLGLRTRMLKSGVVYPGTEIPSEEDNRKFTNLLEKRNADR